MFMFWLNILEDLDLLPELGFWFIDYTRESNLMNFRWDYCNENTHR